MKKFLEIFIPSVVISILFVTAAQGSDVITLIKNGMTTLTGAPVYIENRSATKLAQLDMSGASSLSATAVLQGSLNGTTWNTISTVNITQSGVGYFQAITSPYPYLRANITAISGLYPGSVASGIASAIVGDTYTRVNVLIAE